MDVSKEYILMCSKATEIQEMREFGEDYEFSYEISTDMIQFTVLPRNKSYRTRFNSNALTEVLSLNELHDRFTHISGCKLMSDAFSVIWLPRQDQLQEMVNNPIDMFIWGLNIYTYDGEQIESSQVELVRYFEQFTSMEQLWLAFVMQEKYNKIWDSEKQDWIEQ